MDKKNKCLFDKINIIGLGLIGGSVAKSCRFHNVAQFIYGFDINQNTINFAIDNKIIDQSYSFELKNSKNDLTIICSPLLSYKKVFEQININKGIVIDIGSLKFCVQKWIDSFFGQKSNNFILCHPIAGSEKSGIENSTNDLFLNKKVFITPSKNNSYKDIKKIELFWKNIGSNVDLIDHKKHDKIFALVSHLTQFLAFITKENLTYIDNKIINQHFRLQNSNQKIWQEIFNLNKKNIRYYLSFYLKNIQLIIDDLNSNRTPYILLKTKTLISYQNIESNDSFFEFSVKLQKLLINRIVLVCCFLNLPDIKKFDNYYGSGFKDFIYIVYYLQPLLENKQIINKHQSSIKKFLEEIKSRIISYEFK